MREETTTLKTTPPAVIPTHHPVDAPVTTTGIPIVPATGITVTGAMPGDPPSKATPPQTRGIGSRGLLALDEKTALIAAYQMMITDVSGLVTTADSLIMALDPSLSDEATITAAIASYNAIIVPTLDAAIRQTLVKLNT